MSDVLVLTGAVGVALLLGGAGILLLVRNKPTAEPMAVQRLGPSARRRAARDIAISHGVRLAAMLSRIDGEVHATELDAIHEFITTHVKKADIPFAARVMRAGLDGEVDIGFDDAVAAILEVADDTQKALVIDLLVYVACADGQIHRAETAFLDEVAPKLGFRSDDVSERIARRMAELEADDGQATSDEAAVAVDDAAPVGRQATAEE